MFIEQNHVNRLGHELRLKSFNQKLNDLKKREL